MKLGALKSAIRAHKGPIYAWSARMDFWIAQQQGSLMEALDHRYDKQRNAETEIILESETGRLVKDVD